MAARLLSICYCNIADHIVLLRIYFFETALIMPAWLPSLVETALIRLRG